MTAAVATFLLVTEPFVSGARIQSGLAACDALLRPGESLETAAKCVSRIGDDRAQRPQAIARLEALREQHPDDPWPTFQLAYLEWYGDTARSAELYVLAAEGFATQGREDLAVTAFLNAARMFGNIAEYVRATELVDRAAAAAVRSEDPDTIVKVQVDRAHILYLGGRDLAGAYRILLDIESRVRAISAAESSNWLDSVAAVTYDLGLLRQSLAYRRQLIDELDAAGETWWMAQAKYGFTITYRVLYESSLSIRSEYLELLRDAYETALEGENETVEVLAGMELGKVLGGAEGRAYLERCRARATEQGYERGAILCARSLAGLTSDEDPDAANRLLNASIDRATAGGDLQARIFGAAERLMIRWRALPRQMAVDDALATLDLIETYRRLQSSSSGRTGVFSVWAPTYQRVAGLVLGGTGEGAAPADANDVAIAFGIIERMRARTLLDDLEREKSLPSLADADAGADYAAALRTIVETQSALLGPGLDSTRRAGLREDLLRAENEELALREQLTREDPRLRAWMPDFAALDPIRQELAADEAMLSFQVSLWENVYGNFEGGAWLLAITRDGTRAYRLPDRTTLDAAAPAFANLASRRDEAWQARAAPLYKALLDNAVRDLPAGVDKLILVPDGPLHQVPFAILGPAGGEPLIARYALTVVPSATLWHRWRAAAPDAGVVHNDHTAPASESVSAAAPASVLVLADPVLANAGEGVVALAGGRIGSTAHLGPLPYARLEGRSIARHLGSRATLLVAEDASEAAVKQSDLGRYALIHFAAHAVVDEDLPERSAVYLAAGSPDEDGLLQGREIAALPLHGKTVVLSGCQSAAGVVLQGEGVMSLARSFFQAGATTVVGSLWPLRDDDAAALFDAFYDHLAGGLSVAAAMRAAQNDRRAAGAPAAAWAGLVVLGDGSAVPFPGGGGTPGRTPIPTWVLLFAAAGLTAFGYTAHRVSAVRRLT